ncbi:SH3 and cysteine-rich domain-containing protein [Trichinella papuae]|uniref:SH3 and cysteine-rich domain-containing protein n=1 Tax=Trichinella papuae TaxID=268474 RepID=A0A0V1MZ31_9BILA|nr:SH3 and cysteine-rich domain-containing protein [Trichinella papuae]
MKILPICQLSQHDTGAVEKKYCNRKIKMEVGNSSAEHDQEQSEKEQQSCTAKTAAVKRWKKVFKVFKVNQAFLDLRKDHNHQRQRNKKRFENSIDEEDSEEQEQKADIVDPVYLALKHAQMISASKDDRHSCDTDDYLVEETLNKQNLQELNSSKILPVASSAKVELNTEENAVAIVAPSLKSQLSASALNLKAFQANTSKASGLTATTKIARAMSQPPANRTEERKKTKVSENNFNQRHFKVPRLKQPYLNMQNKSFVNYKQIKRSMFFDKYVVIHEFRAKFPGELDLRLGDIITITDVNDTDWWTGCKAEDVYGRFPKTSVERIRFHEQILLVKQNLHLWEEQRNIRLYRDQIVFGQRNAENGFVTVRTAKDHYINCPVDYLTPLT